MAATGGLAAPLLLPVMGAVTMGAGTAAIASVGTVGGVSSVAVVQFIFFFFFFFFFFYNICFSFPLLCVINVFRRRVCLGSLGFTTRERALRASLAGLISWTLSRPTLRAAVFT